MADPRKTIERSGIKPLRVTFLYDSSITFNPAITGNSAAIGRAVKLTGDGTVGLAGDGDRVHGRLEVVEHDGICTVLVQGYFEFPAGVSATFALGAGVIGALGPSGALGYVKGVGVATNGVGRVGNDADLTRVQVIIA